MKFRRLLVLINDKQEKQEKKVIVLCSWVNYMQMINEYEKLKIDFNKQLLKKIFKQFISFKMKLMR